MSLDVTLLNDYCFECGRSDEVFSQNITHNLTTMAEEAGIYKIVWRPEEVSGLNDTTKAHQLIGPLEKAIADMKADPDKYKKHNSPNGWGIYDHFVPWLEKYLAACIQYPDAKVVASR